MLLDIKENFSLSTSTVYKIGGPARFFISTKNSQEVIAAANFAQSQNMHFVILGAGSNVLVSDDGYKGVVIHPLGGEVNITHGIVSADAGVMMAMVVQKSSQAGLGGIEWGIGIPGTVGGSVRGNAGCFGSEIKDVLKTVEILDAKSGEIFNLQKNECEFTYRNSIFKKHPEWIILSAKFELTKLDDKEIQNKIKEISKKRIATQDIGTKSCGCIFKNVSWRYVDKKMLISKFPELTQFIDFPNIPSSFLIDRAELKGVQVGKIFVSKTHGNFFVNKGGGTCEEVLILISMIKNKVFRKYGIELKEEIQLIGI